MEKELDSIDIGIKPEAILKAKLRGRRSKEKYYSPRVQEDIHYTEESGYLSLKHKVKDEHVQAVANAFLKYLRFQKGPGFQDLHKTGTGVYEIAGVQTGKMKFTKGQNKISFEGTYPPSRKGIGLHFTEFLKANVSPEIMERVVIQQVKNSKEKLI